LREVKERTGAGVMDCKKHLIENNMDVEKAVEAISKIARSTIGKNRTTSAGRLAFAAEGPQGIMCELVSETDFVSGNKNFQEATEGIASSGLKYIQNQSNLSNIFTLEPETLLKETYDNSDILVEEKISELKFSMKETIKLERIEGISLPKGNNVVNGYIHSGRIGVLVGLEGGNPTPELAKNLAIHVVANSPKYIHSTEVPEGEEVKSDDILLEQAYLHDESQTVKQVLEANGNPSIYVHKLIR